MSGISGQLLENVRKLGEQTSIPASGKMNMGVINCQQFRDLILTVQGTYNSSATGTITVNVYYGISEKPGDFDTEAYLTYSAAASTTAMQKTVICDVPDVGYLQVVIVNNDGNYAFTNAQVFYSFSRHQDTYKGNLFASQGGQLSQTLK